MYSEITKQQETLVQYSVYSAIHAPLLKHLEGQHLGQDGKVGLMLSHVGSFFCAPGSDDNQQIGIGFEFCRKVTDLTLKIRLKFMKNREIVVVIPAKEDPR